MKLYVGQDDKLQRDFTAQLGEEEIVGQVEFKNRWLTGYSRMTVVQFPDEG